MITKHRIARETVPSLISAQLSASQGSLLKGWATRGAQDESTRSSRSFQEQCRLAAATYSPGIPTEGQKQQEEKDEQLAFSKHLLYARDCARCFIYI